MSPNGKLWTYAEKLAQANREAKATALALLATVIAWIVLGFGLAGVDVEIFHTPLWVVGGTIGTWIFALVVCVVLEKFVFIDFDLDDEDSALVPTAVAAAAGLGAAGTGAATAANAATTDAVAAAPIPTMSDGVDHE